MMNGEWEMACAALAGVGAGVLLAWVCWQIFGEDERDEDAEEIGGGTARWGQRALPGGKERRDGGAVRVLLEPEVTQEDVRSFYAKLDGPERNVPLALVAEWKRMAAEKMAAVHSAEEFAFEQGRLAAFGEMERAFLELATELKTPGGAGESGWHTPGGAANQDGAAIQAAGEAGEEDGEDA